VGRVGSRGSRPRLVEIGTLIGARAAQDEVEGQQWRRLVAGVRHRSTQLGGASLGDTDVDDGFEARARQRLEDGLGVAAGLEGRSDDPTAEVGEGLGDLVGPLGRDRTLASIDDQRRFCAEVVRKLSPSVLISAPPKRPIASRASAR
jgi:hypothetical protein